MSQSFNELVKNFNMIRPYARDFYLNGFKSREAFRQKSLRSYDNERRRIESYLHPYIQTEQTDKGKNLRLVFDPADLDTNPLFKLWQTKSFTKNDIFLHFVLLDALSIHAKLSLKGLTALIHDDYLSQFEEEQTPVFSEITIRNKLKESVQLGIIQEQKIDGILYYQLVAPIHFTEEWIPVLQFFKETLPGGVLGQFLLDKLAADPQPIFSFKHQFISRILDEQVSLTILQAIRQHRYLYVTQDRGKESKVVPAALYSSTENGREYLIGFRQKNQLFSIRIDHIKKIETGEIVKEYQVFQQFFLEKQSFSWNGHFFQRPAKKLRVLLQIDQKTEDFLVQRLHREQRMGVTQRMDEHTVSFEIELIDLFAINPFLRTFTGRIIAIETDDLRWKKRFIEDMKEMIDLYLPEEGSQ